MHAACAAGYYCLPELVTVGDVSSVITLCPEGFYCPNGTGYDWQSCPAGTYSDVRGLAAALECTPCDAGYYCSGTSVTSSRERLSCLLATVLIYTCTVNSDSQQQVFLLGVNNTSPTGLCWAGYYCVSGIDRPNPLYLNDSQCPTDTVHPRIGHTCPTGAYCEVGSDYFDGCAPGYYQVKTQTSGGPYPFVTCIMLQMGTTIMVLACNALLTCFECCVC